MITYDNTYGMQCPPSMAAMGPPSPGEVPSARAADILDAAAASGTRNGYIYHLFCDLHGFAFTITADPVDDSPGKDHFFVDETFVVRQETGAPATVDSLPSREHAPDTPARLTYKLKAAVMEYDTAYGGFPATLAALASQPKGQKPNANAANLIDAELAAGNKLGYRFRYQLTGAREYTINADPGDQPRGVLSYFMEKPHYYISDKTFLRRESHGPATATSPTTLEWD